MVGILLFFFCIGLFSLRYFIIDILYVICYHM